MPVEMHLCQSPQPDGEVLTASILLANWKDKDFWRKLCPNMSIVNEFDEDAKEAASIRIEKENDETTKLYFDTLKRRIHHEGFATMDSCIVPDDDDIANLGQASLASQPNIITALRDGIEVLHRNGFPATFIFLFDAAWELASRSRHILEQCTLESNQFNFDILAWRISDEDGAGFSPHRDRQPDDVQSSFSVDGHPKYVTQWVALTPATPETSCLYVIPSSHDPGYLNGDDDENISDENNANNAKASDPLQRALPNKEAFQHIRAIPRNPGQSVLFTHRIIHWGSARCVPIPKRLPARIAVSLVCSDPSFEKPYVDLQKYFSMHNVATASNNDSQEDQRTISSFSSSISYYKPPPFFIRLLLVCAQMLIYHDRFRDKLSRKFLKACYDYCKENESELEASYRQKVFVEFVKSVKDRNRTARKIDTEGDVEPSVKRPAAEESLSSNKRSATVAEIASESNQSPTFATRQSTEPGICETHSGDETKQQRMEGDISNDIEDDEEAAMEEILNAEEGGYGDFQDDYDDDDDDGDCDASNGDQDSQEFDESAKINFSNEETR